MKIKKITLHAGGLTFNVAQDFSTDHDEESLKKGMREQTKLLNGEWFWFWDGSSYQCLGKDILQKQSYFTIEVDKHD